MGAQHPLGDSPLTHPSTPIAAPGSVFNFAQHLMALNQQRTSKAAYIDDQGSLSYGDLAQRVGAMAAALLPRAFAAKSACCC
jgi:benzoate-CoA ligase